MSPCAQASEHRFVVALTKRVSRTIKVSIASTLVGFSTLCCSAPARAQAGPNAPPDAGAPRPAQAPAWSDRVHVSGLVDVYAVLNPSRPADRENWVPGTGTTAKRANELALNLAAVDVLVDPTPVGARVALNIGNGTEVLHGAEPSGAGIGVRAFTLVYIAYLSAKVSSPLTLDAGIFPSHVGLEGFYSKDNWNYTRGWASEFSPYYQTGIRATYQIVDHLSAQLHVLNGWQTVGDNNDGKTLGTQIAWSTEALALSLNTLVGPELTKDNDHLRFLVDSVATWKPQSWLGLSVTADLGHQQLPGDRSATWHAASGLARFGLSSTFAVTLRGEYFRDSDGGITGASQTLGEGTATLEWRPWEALILKLEGRYDRSTAPVFHAQGTHTDPMGANVPDTRKAQTLVVLGIVATL